VWSVNLFNNVAIQWKHIAYMDPHYWILAPCFGSFVVIHVKDYYLHWCKKVVITRELLFVLLQGSWFCIVVNELLFTTICCYKSRIMAKFGQESSPKLKVLNMSVWQVQRLQMMHLEALWWTQLWVQRWRQWKEMELGCAPWLVALWR